jgi:SAM-dependent methyltransferase
VVNTPSKLHLGCGLNAVDGWLNVDGSWNARLAKLPWLRRAMATVGLISKEAAAVPWRRDLRILDVREALPFPASSFEAVYASHLLEHLFLADAQRLLRECFRVLRPGGVIRIVVPDLRPIVQEYLGERPFHNSDEFAAMAPADRMNRRLHFRNPNPPRGNVVLRVYAALTDFQTHKWMYDATSLVGHLRVAGFDDVEQRDFRVSRISDIDRIEHPARVLRGEGVCVEGLKPVAASAVVGARQAERIPEKVSH